MLAQLIKDYLIQDAGVSQDVLDRPGLMVSDLGLDSLSLVEMMFEVEDRCGFQLNEPLRFQTMSFAAMLATIEAEVREHHGGELPNLEGMGSAVGSK
jgi:acyl carrier protein